MRTFLLVAIVYLTSCGGPKVAPEAPAHPQPPSDRAAPVPPALPQFDSDGDPLPPGAVARMNQPRQVTWLHRSLFPNDRTATFTPDGKHVVTLVNRYRVAVWDVPSGRLVRDTWLLPRPDFSTGLPQLSRDGSTVAVPFFAHTGMPGDVVQIRVWDTMSGEVRRTIEHTATRIGSESFALTPDGTRLVWPLSDTPKQIVVWDLASGEKSVVTPQSPVPEDLWPSQTPTGDRVLKSPDGQYQLRPQQLDDTVTTFWQLTDTASGKELWTGPAKDVSPQPVNQLSFSADGRYIAAVRDSSNQALFAWDTSTGKRLATTAFSATHMLAAAADEPAFIWGGLDFLKPGTSTAYHILDMPTGKQTEWPASRDRLTAMLRDGRHLGGYAGHIVDKDIRQLLDIPTHTPEIPNPLPTPPVFEPTEMKCIHTDSHLTSKLFAWLGGPSPEFSRTIPLSQQTISVSAWDMATGALIARHTEKDSRRVQSYTMPDGKLSGKLGPRDCRWVQVTPDGRILLIGRTGVRIWHPRSGIPPREILTDPQSVACFAVATWAKLSPDGTRLATPLQDGQIMIWDVPIPTP